MKKTARSRIDKIAAFAAAFLLFAVSAFAQEAPPPHKSPRVPVHRQTVVEPKVPPRDLEGLAAIIDGEHLRIEDTDLRLFGIVPPQLSASFGPQARSALDTLVGGRPVSCHIRDRDQAGHFLATCRVAGTDNDLALELLRRGLAATARGSLEPTELAAPYETAEDSAQKQKLGLWSAPQPAAVSLTAVAPKPESAAQNPAMPPLPRAETILPPVPPVELKKEEKPPEKKTASPEKLAPNATDLDLVNQTEAALPPGSVLPLPEESLANGPGFFARYQLLIAGLLMLATALSIIGAVEYQRRVEKRDEMKAIAAALRGELLAARAVCQARIKTWSEADDRNAAWPRIRSTLYQAYAGKLGFLGATLARQIASIYGQASDYAAYYGPNPAPQAEAPPPRKQALQTLARHIEEVLPRLAYIEETGVRPGEQRSAPPPALSAAPVMPAGPEEGPAAEIVPQTGIAAAFSAWDSLKKLARDHLAAPRGPDINPAMQEQMPDYASLIEEEVASLSFGAESAAEKTPNNNVSKIRETGS